MSTVSQEDFLFRVDQIATEQPSYRKGGDGSDGTCDCIGLIIGALRRAGGTWKGSHGSNYAARNEMENLEKIVSPEDLGVGDIVYKGLSPGEKGYDADTIEKSYKNHPDQHDYYHVGVVVRASPELQILHMTTPTIKLDTKLGKWNYHGGLIKIRNEVGPTETVTIGGGNPGLPVNMRSKMSTSSTLIDQIPQGSQATLLEGDGTWCKIEYNCRIGYVKAEFVNKAPVSDTMVTIPVELIDQCIAILMAMKGGAVG